MVLGGFPGWIPPFSGLYVSVTSAMISVSVTIAALRFQAVPSIPRMNVFFKASGLLSVPFPLLTVTAFDNTGEDYIHLLF